MNRNIQSLAARISLALWSLLGEDPERIDDLDAATRLALDAVQDEARSRGFSVPVIFGTPGESKDQGAEPITGHAKAAGGQ